jgi:hypothetical protein
VTVHFFLRITKDNTSRLGVAIRLCFGLGLHKREADVLSGIASYLNLDSNVSIYKEEVNLRINKFSEIFQIIIPFFDKHPIQGIKILDFSYFKKIANMMKNKEHLTTTGLTQILEINNGMNKRKEI